MQQFTYHTPESTTKMLFEEGGNHETGLKQTQVQGDWLNYHLLDNLDYCDTLLNIPSSATQFYTNNKSLSLVILMKTI